MDRTFHKSLSNLNANQEKEMKPDRTCSGFITPVVGDVGTCKTNNAAMFRSASYRWVGLCPGDVHNKGSFCEAVFKVHGSSGFHCILVPGDLAPSMIFLANKNPYQHALQA